MPDDPGYAADVALLLVLHAGVALVLPWLARPWGSNAFLIAAAAPAAAAAWSALQLPRILGGGAVAVSYRWAPELGLEPAFRLDALSFLLVALVSLVGVGVLVYCRWYFAVGESRLGRVASILVAFAGAMLGLVLADNVLVLYAFWELTTVCSFLLIGHVDTRGEARRSATRALLVTTGFGLPMLVGLLLLADAGGTYRISALVASPPDGTVVDVAIVLVLVGAFAKAAQVPLHSWLPIAMVAATPVSAYLHAAAMVKAGPYLVARLAPAFAAHDSWHPTVFSVGIASLIIGGWLALHQDDLKLLLAYGTISQLGFLIVLFGAGTHVAGLAGVAMLVAHGLFKATLFLVVGIVEHQEHARHITELTGLARRAPLTCLVAVLAAASMIGLPPFLGYIGKEATFEAFVHGGMVDLLLLATLALGSALTVAYSLRFLTGAFGGAAAGLKRSRNPVPLGFLLAPAAFAIGGLGIGLGAEAFGHLRACS